MEAVDIMLIDIVEERAMTVYPGLEQVNAGSEGGEDMAVLYVSFGCYEIIHVFVVACTRDILDISTRFAMLDFHNYSWIILWIMGLKDTGHRRCQFIGEQCVNSESTYRPGS